MPKSVRILMRSAALKRKLQRLRSKYMNVMLYAVTNQLLNRSNAHLNIQPYQEPIASTSSVPPFNPSWNIHMPTTQSSISYTYRGVIPPPWLNWLRHKIINNTYLRNCAGLNPHRVKKASFKIKQVRISPLVTAVSYDNDNYNISKLFNLKYRIWWANVTKT